MTIHYLEHFYNYLGNNDDKVEVNRNQYKKSKLNYLIKTTENAENANALR